MAEERLGRVEAGEPGDAVGEGMSQLVRVNRRPDAGAATDAAHRSPDRLSIARRSGRSSGTYPQ